jgi:hypothetical protein
MVEEGQGVSDQTKQDFVHVQYDSNPFGRANPIDFHTLTPTITSDLLRPLNIL